VKRYLNPKCGLKCVAALRDAKNAPVKVVHLEMAVPLAKVRTVQQRRIVQLALALLSLEIVVQIPRLPQVVTARKAAHAQPARIAVTRADAHLAVAVALIKRALHPVIHHLRAQVRVAVLRAVKVNALPANAVPVLAAAHD
jgi:hypothetical protein